MDGYTDKPHHRVEIFVCLIAAALILFLFMPLVPYLNSQTLPPMLYAYSYVLVVLYFAIGTLAFYIIRKRGGKKPVIREWDPPMTRYQHTYGPNTDIYTTKINREGDFVTTKETRLGGSIDDKWGKHASSGSAALDKISNFYGKMIFVFLVPCIYLLAGGTFMFWALPYILIMLVRDNIAKSHNKAVPKPLQRAYRQCRKLYGNPPISYDDKAGYLVSREKHKEKRAEETNSFLAHYKEHSDDGSAPYFYTRKDNVSYMIVEYKRVEGKNYGVCFVLVSDGRDIKKRIVVADGFIPTDPENWAQDWREAGVSNKTLEHLDWYEEKMKKIMRGVKRNSEIVG